MLDSCLKERFGRDFRHYEHSLRVVERLERDGAGLNLTEQVRDGIARHSSRAPLPRTLEGRIVRVIDRVAYINHDIDDAVRAGLLREDELPREPIAVLGDSGSARIDALVHDMVEHSARAGDIVQGPRGRAGDGRRCASSCSSASTWARRCARSTRKIARRDQRACSSTTSSTPSCCRAAPRARTAGTRGRARAAGDGLPRGDDRSLLHPRATPSCRCRRRSPASVAGVALYTNESKDRVRDAVDFVELVSARTELRRAGPARYEGLCPFHDERTPSFGIDPVQKVYHCFGCQASGDVFTFVQETEGVDFKGALELLAERYGVELRARAGGSRARPSGAARASGCSSC